MREGQASPKLIIFDCDGVLIDSERIFARALAQGLRAGGYPSSEEEALALGLGLDDAAVAAAVRARFGRPLPEGFFARMRENALSRFATELKPIAGTAELLKGLQTPCCVASNSPLEVVRLGLELTGLSRFFGPRLYSAERVARGKPAPDLLLLAAEELGASPSATLVVEDSLGGVEAALAAGMTAVGFCGGSHCGRDHKDRLAAAGCRNVFSDMADLAVFLCARAASSSLSGDDRRGSGKRC